MIKTNRALFLFSLLAAGTSLHAAKADVLAGIDVLQTENFKALKNKRVGLITNATGRARTGISTAQLLAQTPGVSLVTIFAPEHGITGSTDDDNIANSEITLAGRRIPVRSLSPSSLEHMRPKAEDLANLDVVVFDIQDIGARFYTYVATMGMAMEETAKANIEMMILDRPNPLTGEIIEGPILDDLSLRRVTSTAYYPVSIRHGMTAGEIATMYDAELHHPKLTVVRLQGWTRGLWYDQTGLAWTNPSPNIPNLNAATMYPGIALFEALPENVLSVGRGTPVPFQWIGAPWMNADLVVKEVSAAGLEGVIFAAQDYSPTKSMFSGQLCHGVQMTITDRTRLRPTKVFLALMLALRKLHREDMKWAWTETKKMVGTERFRQIYESDGDPAKFRELFEGDAATFAKKRAPYLLY